MDEQLKEEQKVFSGVHERPDSAQNPRSALIAKKSIEVAKGSTRSTLSKEKVQELVGLKSGGGYPHYAITKPSVFQPLPTSGRQ
jgi:hypothetical protein